MTKKFTLLQLFSLLDGRLSTKIEDVYDMLNHICDTDLMTHHLPVAMDYLKEKNPKWFQDGKSILLLNGIMPLQTDFKECLEILKSNPQQMEIPQLKDEFDTSDFAKYMIDNSLLLKRLNK